MLVFKSIYLPLLVSYQSMICYFILHIFLPIYLSFTILFFLSIYFGTRMRSFIFAYTDNIFLILLLIKESILG